ncbi:CDP-alcohol phosphatidyltransferase family protein [Halonatronum saccharophilum]|uniref:CDP-alcohol phosphatidyltransferase family protein n=1 Tax=Halonatronum saccharophilum TaxID=150060 RepID=UPI000487808A|nr:CDP-alcohol phosphatidyltransferase family protein [Halonatronum saccharophilum]
MLDSKGRKYVEPLIERTASILLSFGLSANFITWVAFLIGALTGLFVYFNYSITAIILLWLSGFLDAVDGSMARKSKNTTSWGTVMDVTFDRVVELSLIIGLALKYPLAQFPLILLLGAIILSMTIFLTVGAVSKNEGIKSFHYQAGVAERTEGFIFLTLMTLIPNKITLITLIFAATVLFTALQRMAEAKRILSK